MLLTCTKKTLVSPDFNYLVSLPTKNILLTNKKKLTESDKNSAHFWKWQTRRVNIKEIQGKSNT